MNFENFSFQTLVFQGLNGLAFSMLLFLLAAGLSLIFGLMDVINPAHGAYYLLGAYFGYSVVNFTHNFWLGLLLAPIAVGFVGFIMERGFLRRLYNQPHGNLVILSLGMPTFWGT